jgi:carboxymethylenebutenolidase
VLPKPEQTLSDVWDQHVGAEFVAHDPNAAIATMIANPRNHHVPVMTGGEGPDEVYQFYARYFLPQIPPDLEIIPVSRTVGQGRVVDEFICRFTHTIAMEWMLPGIPRTGKRVEVAAVGVVQFDGDKVASERLYWDQASVLVQLGLLDPRGLPVVGAESARSVVDRTIRLNDLIRRGESSVAPSAPPPG